MTEETARKRILIVDDTYANLKLLGSALKRNYRISVATNGEDALKIAFSDNLPDLILLDIVMPGLDGYEVCKRLREDERTHTIPVIFITAKSMVEDEQRGLECGAVDYIIKPFSLPIVEARVRTHLELKRHRDMLERMSILDGLTGISNRRHFDEIFAIEWRRAIRNAVPLSLIMMDIDSFKMYNDHYGHQAGDDVIQQVAQCLISCARRTEDLVSRYGGEEFVAILPGCSEDAAVHVAETMRCAVAALNIAHEFSKAARTVTISLGVSTHVPGLESTPETLLKNADRMLYESKMAGRNRVTAGILATPLRVNDEQQKDNIEQMNRLKRLHEHVRRRILDEDDWQLLMRLSADWVQEQERIKRAT